MNAKMLMLGILLIAGLSFAAVMDWTMYASERYACNYYYNAYGFDSYGLMMIAEEYNDGYWDQSAMEGNIEGMHYSVWGKNSMCYYSGCNEEPSPSDFRGSMLQYSVYSASFRAEFLAGLRAYLLDGGDRGAIIVDLQDALNGYRYCLVYYRSPCDACSLD